MSQNRIWVTIGQLAIMVLLNGCSTFNRDWNAAVTSPRSGILGPWEGVWKSETTGHTDKLRCLVSERNDHRYEARFHAKYRNIFVFNYTVLLGFEKTDSELMLSGKADLGYLPGGVYEYNGKATPTNFVCRYSSAHDWGTFVMHRPGVN
jgi:hypothetical protein